MNVPDRKPFDATNFLTLLRVGRESTRAVTVRSNQIREEVSGILNSNGVNIGGIVEVLERFVTEFFNDIISSPLEIEKRGESPYVKRAVSVFVHDWNTCQMPLVDKIRLLLKDFSSATGSLMELRELVCSILFLIGDVKSSLQKKFKKLGWDVVNSSPSPDEEFRDFQDVVLVSISSLQLQVRMVHRHVKKLLDEQGRMEGRVPALDREEAFELLVGEVREGVQAFVAEISAHAPRGVDDRMVRRVVSSVLRRSAGAWVEEAVRLFLERHPFVERSSVNDKVHSDMERYVHDLLEDETDFFAPLSELVKGIDVSSSVSKAEVLERVEEVVRGWLRAHKDLFSGVVQQVGVSSEEGDDGEKDADSRMVRELEGAVEECREKLRLWGVERVIVKNGKGAEERAQEVLKETVMPDLVEELERRLLVREEEVSELFEAAVDGVRFSEEQLHKLAEARWSEGRLRLVIEFSDTLEKAKHVDKDYRDKVFGDFLRGSFLNPRTSVWELSVIVDRLLLEF